MSRVRASPVTITFRAERALAEILEAMDNRSDFIRSAVLQALQHTCPLCGGRGVLTPHQRRHWGQFQRTHRVVRCRTCRATHLICAAQHPEPHEAPATKPFIQKRMSRGSATAQ